VRPRPPTHSDRSARRGRVRHVADPVRRARAAARRGPRRCRSPTWRRRRPVAALRCRAGTARFACGVRHSDPARSGARPVWADVHLHRPRRVRRDGPRQGMTTTIELPWPSGFSLAASSRFVMNFAASQGGEAASALNLTFALDRTWLPVGVRVTAGDGVISAEVVTNPEGASAASIHENLVRILNLHVENDPLARIGSEDRIVEHLRQRYPGLRPVQFPTPWEAAAWAVIGHRVRITQAAAIKQRLSAQFGHRTEFPGGQVLDSFPGPEVLLSLPAMPGLTVRKFDTLRGIARATLDGVLDAERLLSLPSAKASSELQSLYGIGPFSAELIL